MRSPSWRTTRGSGWTTATISTTRRTGSSPTSCTPVSASPIASAGTRTTRRSSGPRRRRRPLEERSRTGPFSQPGVRGRIRSSAGVGGPGSIVRALCLWSTTWKRLAEPSTHWSWPAPWRPGISRTPWTREGSGSTSPGCVRTSPCSAARSPGRCTTPTGRPSTTTATTSRWTHQVAGPCDDDRATRHRGRRPGPRKRHACPAPRGGHGPDTAHRPLVAPAAADGSRAGRVHHLLDVPRLPERALLRRALHLTVLLALPHDGLRGGHVPEAVHRPGLDLPGALHPDLPARFPADLLLLPQGLLPVVLALAARVRGRGAARAVHRRDAVSAGLPERAQVLLLRGAGLQRHPHLRRGPRLPRRDRRVGTP